MIEELSGRLGEKIYIKNSLEQKQSLNYEQDSSQTFGESFADPVSNFGIQPETIERIASEITEATIKVLKLELLQVVETSSEVVQESAKNMAQAKC